MRKRHQLGVRSSISRSRVARSTAKHLTRHSAKSYNPRPRCPESTCRLQDLRREARALKECVADLTLDNRLLKKSMVADGGNDE